MSKRWASRKSPRARCGWPYRTLAAERSEQLAVTGVLLAGQGADELATAAVAGAAAKDAARAGVAEIAAGAREVGKGEAVVVAGEALQARASQ